MSESYGLTWLADQCPAELVEIWTPMYNLRLERDFWWHVMNCQRMLGVDIPGWAMRASARAASYPSVMVMERVKEREKITRHDVKARLEIFCEEAGHEYHHLGMTSADLVDNVAQIKILRSARFLRREHRVALPFIDRYPMRGIKGAVGTHQDQLDLLGSEDACLHLDAYMAKIYGFNGTMIATGQVYPRSIDLEALSELSVATCRPGSAEAFRACLAGFTSMAAAYSGDQWNEGDVSTSVVRRVCIPGAFFAAHLALAGESSLCYTEWHGGRIS